MRKAEIIGNVGRDAEPRVTGGGTKVLNFTVAANGRKKEEEVVWVRCALFGDRGDKLQQYLTKGTRVFVRGEFRVRAWEKGEKSGVDVEIAVDEIELLGGGEKRDAAEPAAEPDPWDKPAPQGARSW